MINSVFRKTMENLRKRINVKLIDNAKDYVRYVSRRSFLPVLTLDKSIYVGFNILELGKSIMHEFHYKYIKNKFDAKLLFTDTDT